VSEGDNEVALAHWGLFPHGKKKCDFKYGLEVAHCRSYHYHHHGAMVLTNNPLNIEKLVWGGRVGVVRSVSVLFCS
jgi:hypothetical protein